MTGLNVVHDREKLVLGWQEADCKFLISHNPTKEINYMFKKKGPFLLS